MFLVVCQSDRRPSKFGAPPTSTPNPEGGSGSAAGERAASATAAPLAASLLLASSPRPDGIPGWAAAIVTPDAEAAGVGAADPLATELVLTTPVVEPVVMGASGRPAGAALIAGGFACAAGDAPGRLTDPVTLS